MLSLTVRDKLLVTFIETESHERSWELQLNKSKVHARVCSEQHFQGNFKCQRFTRFRFESFTDFTKVRKLYIIHSCEWNMCVISVIVTRAIHSFIWGLTYLSAWCCRANLYNRLLEFPCFVFERLKKVLFNCSYFTWIWKWHSSPIIRPPTVPS